MKPFRTFITILALLILTFGLGPVYRVQASSRNSALNQSAGDLLDAVNSLRAEKGLPAYRNNSTLTAIAQSHAEYLASTGVVTHFSANGARPFQRAISAGYSVAGDLNSGGLFAEIVRSGPNMSAPDLIDLWQQDPNDLKTLISPILIDAGAGMASANGVTYFVLDVAVSSGDAATATPVMATPTLGTPVSTQSGVIQILTPLENGEVYHVVQPKEVLSGIASAYNTTVEQIKSLNQLATDEIFVGQKLLIVKPDLPTETAKPVTTATFGIPTSTSTVPVSPTITSTNTPVPTPPVSLKFSGQVVGGIVLLALLAAGLGSWLGRQREG
jgi:uncharacterized protein YkwD/LysM repeat protein